MSFCSSTQLLDSLARLISLPAIVIVFTSFASLPLVSQRPSLSYTLKFFKAPEVSSVPSSWLSLSPIELSAQT